jgi:CubicO group peptidase (beta-lactamase class C family)
MLACNVARGCLLLMLAVPACAGSSEHATAPRPDASDAEQASRDAREAASDTASAPRDVESTKDASPDWMPSDLAADVQPTSRPGILVSYLGDPAYPDDFWVAVDPAASDVNLAALQRAVETIASSKLEIHSFLVARHGRIVFEQYGWSSGSNPDDPDRTPHQVVPTERYPVHSTTKSFVATLVGIAIGDGLLPGVHDLVVPHFPEYQPLPASSPDKDAITLEDLLTMRSGLQYTTADDEIVCGAPDPAQAMLSRPVVDTPVGTVWNYSSGGSDVIAALVRKAAGETPLVYANRKLLGPLGIENVVWQASANGTNHGGWGIELSSREMARFGELYRNRGLWNSHQIVPADWTDVATSPKCTTPWNGQYGYHFWIPNLPGFFGTRGAYGRNIYVNRELDLVVVLTSDLPTGSADAVLEGLIRTFVIPAVTGSGPDGGTGGVATVDFEVTDIDVAYEGKPVLLGLFAGEADCTSAGASEPAYAGSGTVGAGSSEISIPLVLDGVYTACAFIDADGDSRPSHGDLVGQLSFAVYGDTDETWSATGWMSI